MPVNTLYQDGDNAQLRAVIFDATPTAIAQTKQFAQQFRGKTEIDTCKNIYNFLKNKIRYKEDGFHQKVKLPSALLRERVGDCKSYSVFTYAILYNLGIGCKYVLTSYNNDPTPSHIYVQTDSGIIIDAVWGKFNSEKKPTYKFYKKVDNMRISTISGVKGTHNKIGCNSCSTIGATQGDANKWYSDNKSKLGLKTKDKAKNISNKVLYAAPRGLIRKFIEQNGGGIATSIYRKVYVKDPVKKSVPAQQQKDLRDSYITSAKQKGVKFPNSSQQAEIGRLSSVQVEASELSSQVLTIPTNVKTKTAALTLPEAWNKVMGAGQYNLYKIYFENPYSKALSKLIAEYTLPASKEADIKNWKKFLKSWYEKGGNPYELYESVMEGKNKAPRGKDANYMIMIAKTRGLKLKDVGLVIRGFVSAFGGERFNWGQSGTYIFGYNNTGRIGTGEPASTSAIILGYLKVIASLFALIAPIWSSIKAKRDQSKAKKEMENLETNGYILESDYLKLPTPRPAVTEVKQISVPEFDAPNLDDIGSAIEEFESAYGYLTAPETDESTPQTKQQARVEKKAQLNYPKTQEEFDKKAKEGAFSPIITKAVEEAKTDKGTFDYLSLISKTSRAVPKQKGEVIVTYLKIDTNNIGGEDDSMFAGFGNIILPLLIGGGVLMALNTAKKQKKNG